MDHPLPWLRYVRAGDLDDSSNSLDGMKVESGSAENIGTVDGFIVDVASGRPYHVVVDGGGWLKSRLFLLPVGHVGLSGGAKAPHLVADISKEHTDRNPGFDRHEFETLSEAELERMSAEHRAPGWWESDFDRPDRVDEAARSMAGSNRH